MAAPITPNSLLEPELPEPIAGLLTLPTQTLARATRPACLTNERSPVEWGQADWAPFAAARADIFDWDAVAAQFDRKTYWRDGYAVLKGVMTPQTIDTWTAALQQGQRRNDALLESDWNDIDWPGLGRQPPAQQLSLDDIRRARGNSQKAPQKDDEAGVLTLRHHSVFAEYFPAGHVPYLMNVLTHPQMLALQQLCLESEDIYFDHNQLLTRAPGYDGGGWHCHRIGAGHDEGPADIDAYRLQPNSNLTICYPQGFAATNDGGLKLIRGSHLFRDAAHCRGATDEEIGAGWLQDKVHPVTGRPLAIEHLDLPPGSVVCCLSHAAHGVSPKGGDRPPRWSSLYCYKTTDKRTGLVQPAHGIPLVWALKAQRGELPDVLAELFRPSYDRALTGGRTRFDQL